MQKEEKANVVFSLAVVCVCGHATRSNVSFLYVPLIVGVAEPETAPMHPKKRLKIGKNTMSLNLLNLKQKSLFSLKKSYYFSLK